MTPPILSHELMLRAVALADAFCRSDIECHGVAIGSSSSGRYGLTDIRQREVRSLGQASGVIREAYAYLRDRGLAELLPDDGQGESIQLLLDRFVS